MSAEHNVRPSELIEAPGQQIAKKETAPIATSAVRPWQIYGLMAYYMVLLAGAVALLVFLISSPELALKDETRLLASMGFLASGAIVGSTLYQIRMLFRYYITDRFDPKWLSKYISAPVEAVGLALAVMSLFQSGGVFLGGQPFSMAKGEPFAAFGFGALVGFGIREVVGWVGSLTKTMFTSEHTTDHKAK